jgi:phosphonate degradation associated HDIG domain protein
MLTAMNLMPVSVDAVVRLYTMRAGLRYGSELVSQLEHALQCAQLALAEGAETELVAAAFLHDIGHLVAHRCHEAEREIDDLHQYLAVSYLRGAFGAAVLEPIKLHIDAKRYLCRAEPGYWERLSPASKRSLELQGGAHTPAEGAFFIGQPFARQAVRLRRWDDAANIPDLAVPDLGFVARLLQNAASRHSDRNLVEPVDAPAEETRDLLAAAQQPRRRSGNDRCSHVDYD